VTHAGTHRILQLEDQVFGYQNTKVIDLRTLVHHSTKGRPNYSQQVLAMYLLFVVLLALARIILVCVAIPEAPLLAASSFPTFERHHERRLGTWTTHGVSRVCK
jgi:uncharacterized BrkB/YihY/UPF0761 family membrane protein